MAKYNLYLNGNTRIHVTGGNKKIGKGVFNISLLPSDEPLTKKDGTVINQSVSGISIKDLLNGKVKLVITIVNNGSLVDCKLNSGNSKCLLPNFVGQNRSKVENWLDGLTNNVNVKYIYINSNK